MSATQDKQEKVLPDLAEVVLKPILNVSDVRVLMGVGRTQAYEIMNTMPRLPGRDYRVTRKDFDAWVERNLVTPGS